MTNMAYAYAKGFFHQGTEETHLIQSTHINRFRNETVVELRNESCIIISMCSPSMPCWRNLRKSHWEQCEQDSYPHYVWRNNGRETENNNCRILINLIYDFPEERIRVVTEFRHCLIYCFFYFNKAYCSAMQISK